VAAALRIESLKSVRVLTVVGVCLLAGANAWDHGRLAFGCARQPPVSRQRLLADALTSRGVRAGVAPYWVAYQVSYLSGEAVRLTASRGPRIQDYEALARREGARAVSITDAPCWPSEEQVADWCVVAATP
jgi:hypothetical protein